MGTWLASAAKKTMDLPSLSSLSSSAPLSLSALKAPTWPLAAAVIRGVYELLSAALMLAPLEIKIIELLLVNLNKNVLAVNYHKCEHKTQLVVISRLTVGRGIQSF